MMSVGGVARVMLADIQLWTLHGWGRLVNRQIEVIVWTGHSVNSVVEERSSQSCKSIHHHSYIPGAKGMDLGRNCSTQPNP